MESIFLEVIDYRTFVDEATFAKYQQAVLKFGTFMQKGHKPKAESKARIKA